MDGKHPVSLLQELMTRQRKGSPLYEIMDISTKLMPKFRCIAKAGDVVGTAESSTKQSAKKEAAARVLALLGTTNTAISNDSNLVLTATLNYNAVGRLNEYASQNRMSYPTYCEGGLTNKNEFITTCKLHDIVTEGYGSTKKVAKQFAAHHMLKLCQETALDLKNKTPERLPVTNANIPSDEDIFAKYKELKRDAVSPKMEVEDNSESNSPVLSPLRNPLLEDSTPSKIVESTFEELCDQLKRLTISYTVETIGRKPFVLLLRFRNEQSTTVVETGNTYEEAQCKLFKKAILVINVMKEN